ncbi:16231_t:CDS:2, partial [Funneliformis geosporum]
ASLNWGIGINNKLPWKLKSDMAYFERTSKRILPIEDNKVQNAAIMGRKTWESIPLKFRPLQNRLNVVISKSLKKEEIIDANFVIYSSLDEAITDLSNSSKVSRLFVIGGSQIYKEAITSPNCVYILLTRVYKFFECDTFFPEINEKMFSLTTHEELEEVVGEQVPKGRQVDNGMEYEFLLYKRII